MGMSHDDFPARVRAERKRQRVTQQQLADAAHVSLRTIQMFEGRKSATTPANRHAIAEALGLDENGVAAAGDDPFAEFPRDIQAALLIIGAYLMTKSEEQRMQVVHDLTRQIFEARR